MRLVLVKAIQRLVNPVTDVRQVAAHLVSMFLVLEMALFVRVNLAFQSKAPRADRNDGTSDG
jgi:hypothetical protein